MDYLIYNLSELSERHADYGLLSPEERKTARQRGLRYALIRTLLRQELARRTGCAPDKISFDYGPKGKPICNGQEFNISHSADCLCMAFHQNAVGVDVERMKPRQYHLLAERFMCPVQLDAFLQRDCPQEEFYACWCTAEALVKLHGDTMWNARSYPFVYRNGCMECLFSPAPIIRLFFPMPGYCGAVAYIDSSLCPCTSN